MECYYAVAVVNTAVNVNFLVAGDNVLQLRGRLAEIVAIVGRTVKHLSAAITR